MGTSSSYRSPETPRWKAFNRALDTGQTLERLRAQLFLAGETDWREAFEAPAMATFAETLLEAHEGLAARLAEATQPTVEIRAVVADARRALFDEGYTPALPVAEKALRSVLIATVQGETALADATGPQAAEAWNRNRGEPTQLLQRFVGQVFGEWATHVASRDMARLIDAEQGRTGAQIREASRALSRQVTELAASVPFPGAPSAIGDNWHRLVGAIFEEGRRLELPDEP